MGGATDRPREAEAHQYDRLITHTNSEHSKKRTKQEPRTNGMISKQQVSPCLGSGQSLRYLPSCCDPYEPSSSESLSLGSSWPGIPGSSTGPLTICPVDLAGCPLPRPRPGSFRLRFLICDDRGCGASHRPSRKQLAIAPVASNAWVTYQFRIN